MLSKTGWVRAGLITTAPTISLGAGQAQAVVVCKTAGVPQGCVARVGAPVVAATRVAGVGVGARGVGVRPGTPWNRGGPVNRVGRR
ncbi:hypothetical protein [Rhodopseudomonas sp. P2A-2r]|uniref:hypothetical protein n=1 Tax=unclassified Rhodopseudomonas TaxID=2638247 RepID=UPI002234873B|nr:hypothetical protein [Rhodopseudomonas sp. P2A-2r]UZE50791.1 hypothetical protein ONR75_09210 [Rhodopseudomonas sp. P2A-2r]